MNVKSNIIINAMKRISAITDSIIFRELLAMVFKYTANHKGNFDKEKEALLV